MGTKKDLETSAASKHIGCIILPACRHGTWHRNTETHTHTQNLEFCKNLFCARVYVYVQEECKIFIWPNMLACCPFFWGPTHIPASPCSFYCIIPQSCLRVKPSRKSHVRQFSRNAVGHGCYGVHVALTRFPCTPRNSHLDPVTRPHSLLFCLLQWNFIIARTKGHEDYLVYQVLRNIRVKRNIMRDQGYEGFVILGTLYNEVPL